MRSHSLVLAVVSFTFVSVLLLSAEASAHCEYWTQLNPLAAPSGRYHFAMAYDSTRG